MLDKNILRNLMDKRIRWENTGNPTSPLSATVDGHSLKISINDFPEDELYSLHLNENHLGDFREWPQQWLKPALQLSSPIKLSAKM